MARAVMSGRPETSHQRFSFTSKCHTCLSTIERAGLGIDVDHTDLDQLLRLVLSHVADRLLVVSGYLHLVVTLQIDR